MSSGDYLAAKEIDDEIDLKNFSLRFGVQNS